jgi:hypothetical protein
MQSLDTRTQTAATRLGDISTLRKSWLIHLDAEGLSPRTIRNYLQTFDQFVANRFLHGFASCLTHSRNRIGAYLRARGLGSPFCA